MRTNDVKGAARFTLHALQRAYGYQVSLSDLLSAWQRDTKFELKVKEKEYKFKVYGLKSLDDFYLYDPKTDLAFTCNKPDNRNETTIITVTKRSIANRTFYENEKE